MRESARKLLTGLSVSGWLVVAASTGLGAELPLPPTIQELSGQKVKTGDLITKENVDLIKEYLSLGMYQNVKNGMVLRMSEQGIPPLEERLPKKFLEATERNKGKAIVNDHEVVLLQDGSPWPGGIPFIEPKTGSEVMGYVRFGNSYDDGTCLQNVSYVNKEGRCYKTGVMRIYSVFTQGRLECEPLGVVPGMEGVLQRFVGVFQYPLELKGMGQFQVKHADDYEKYDVGFAYLPAFKRTVRISATTYQDNVGGSDVTFGDAQGLYEPYAGWKFKLIEKKYLLVPEPKRDKRPKLDAAGIMVDPQLEWDIGEKYPRLGWTIIPVYVVEGISKDEGHIYSKKIFYTEAPYYEEGFGPKIKLVDIYDRGGELWKALTDWKGDSMTTKNGEQITGAQGFSMHDLQSNHTTHMGAYFTGVNVSIDPESLTLRTLLKLGR